MPGGGSSIALILLTQYQYKSVIERSHYVTLRYASQQTVVLRIWQNKNENTDMYDFVPVHDCTQEQNGGPCFCSIVRQ